MNHGGKALNGLGALYVTKAYQTLNTIDFNLGVRLCEISFIVKRERAQTTS